MSFKTIQSNILFKGRVFDVRQDEVMFPGGQTTRLDIVAHGGAVVIAPIDNENSIWFVRQYRHAAGKELIELPAGGLEAGEEPDACALRELQEEIGMIAGHLEKIGEFFLAPGYSTELLYIYIARELSSSALPRDEDEFLTIDKTPLNNLYIMATRGEIQDAKTLATLFLLQQRLL